MKIPANCKIELCASDDETRYVLTHPYLDMTDPEKPVIVATDGKRMAVIPVTVEEGECSGFVAKEALAAARKAAGKKGVSMIHCNGACETGGVRYPRPEFDGRNYPNWRQVIPDYSKVKTVKLSLNVDLLMGLAKGMGVDSLELTIAPDEDGGVTAGLIARPLPEKGQILPEGTFGVIMPMRIS